MELVQAVGDVIIFLISSVALNFIILTLRITAYCNFQVAVLKPFPG